ncbi:hypothetical protein MLD38_012083 [Melastoma candidum]|uniref:Uncharacterized protein n=1 Tax=Melastoma candidum TaxID=119954 RepID=A0ACB9R4R9_9MYRT|nr:hypothetical protein MLD38_012083 [Melastoma candidum]
MFEACGEACEESDGGRDISKSVSDRGIVARSGEAVREASRSEAMGRHATRRIGSAGDLAMYKEFEEWMIRHEKFYHSEAEKQRRFQIFKNVVKETEYLNERNDGCGYALNQFSDMTAEEFGKTFCGDIPRTEGNSVISQAVSTVFREADDKSVSLIPFWEIPIWKDISPKQKKVNEALKLVNDTLDNLISICKRMVDEEDLQFHEECMNEQDPSILHFLLASGDYVSSKQLRDDLMTMLIAGHETFVAVLTWTFYLLSKGSLAFLPKDWKNK